MNFNILFGFFLLFCVSVSLETSPCLPDDVLKEFEVMKKDLKDVEARLTINEIKVEVIETKLKEGEARLQDVETRLERSENKLLDTESRLNNTVTRLQDVEIRLDLSDIKLQDIETRLKDAETMLLDTQTRLSNTETGLQDTQTRLDLCETGLQDTQTKLSDIETRVQELENKDQCNCTIDHVLNEFEDMKKDLKDVEARLTDSETKLEDTETRLTEGETRLNDTETGLQDTQTRLNVSENQIQELKNIVSAQEDRNALETRSNLNGMLDLLKEFGAMTEKLKAVNARLQDSENQIRDLKNKERTKVVFSTALGGPDRPLGPFNTDTTLAFKRVFTNIGNAYSAYTGIFTAPVAGVYYFSMFFHAGGGRRAFLYLYKNSEAMLDSSDHASSTDTADNGGNAGFLQLQRGDQVYVRLPANCHVWANERVTTFSGFLVHLV
ncbi:complement C1q-like protein 4 [Xyrichtys novacula]|uniref:Complement C1q-like protein 4 n=1 Tax=Xyrichtys novacula TaxID=13765 RepID=A0AAV1HJC8_XYRNO|nr:complement C1q-like protein 4 [Xyrichtys novacula]